MFVSILHNVLSSSITSSLSPSILPFKIAHFSVQARNTYFFALSHTSDKWLNVAKYTASMTNQTNDGTRANVNVPQIQF